MDQRDDDEDQEIEEPRRRHQRIAVYLDPETVAALTRWRKEQSRSDSSSGSVNRALAIFLGVKGWEQWQGFGAAWMTKTPAHAAPQRRAGLVGRLVPPGFLYLVPDEKSAGEESGK